jgi:hypothetical protein
MKDQKNVLITVLAVLGLFFSTSSIADGLDPDLAPQNTVNICVAKISDHADYTAATRVRHEVESEQRRTIGHILRIDTLVYGDADGKLLREYATKCVVGNSLKPLRFEIEEAHSRS